MYGPFLEKQDKQNVSVGQWQRGEWKGAWCEEQYDFERTVSFNFWKQTIGKTLVDVKHTQRCRRAGDDQCIVQITMEMKGVYGIFLDILPISDLETCPDFCHTCSLGFPYADCFAVEVRHVASRVGEHDLSVKIGLHVNFLKSCMLESKIKANTGAETTKAQLMLMEMIAGGCAPYAKEAEGPESDGEDEDETMETEVALAPASRGPIVLPDPVFKALRFILMSFVTIFRTYLQPYIQPELFDPIPPSSVEEALGSARERVKLLEEIGCKSIPESRRKDVAREIASIEKSINMIEKICDER